MATDTKTEKCQRKTVKKKLFFRKMPVLKAKYKKKKKNQTNAKYINLSPYLKSRMVVPSIASQKHNSAKPL